MRKLCKNSPACEDDVCRCDEYSIEEEIAKIQKEFNFKSFGSLADFIIQKRPGLSREIQLTGRTVGQLSEYFFNQTNGYKHQRD